MIKLLGIWKISLMCIDPIHCKNEHFNWTSWCHYTILPRQVWFLCLSSGGVWLGGSEIIMRRRRIFSRGVNRRSLANITAFLKFWQECGRSQIPLTRKEMWPFVWPSNTARSTEDSAGISANRWRNVLLIISLIWDSTICSDFKLLHVLETRHLRFRPIALPVHHPHAVNI